ncbi:hypothetical protein [Frigoriglobus tundricola]|uniref:Uncharacterized protein n=1 Tax=Frigoriglobus tundricola TaxID=2774151 RepID=A0A6M5YMF5_9BACT|nr:hypothetical protein [Frigoriglobus tundricola]QJW94421.1 hypothetical protein FTUN_1941 [Frigoriglobus tundricola]
MRKSLAVFACVAAVSALAGAVLLADSPPPTEEQIGAELKEARKRTEAAQAEERALQKRLEGARAQPRGRISADVEGVLCWRDKGGGYYVRIRQRDDPAREVRVALVVPEDKFLVGRLDGLKGQDVVVKGTLLQKADGELYLDDFGAEDVRAPKRK